MPRLPNFPAPPPVYVVVDGDRGGEPLKTMTAETITALRLASLRAMLDIAADSIARLEYQADDGTIDHAEASDIVNETIQNLTNEAR